MLSAVFSPEITLGNALTFAGALVTWGVTWGAVKADQLSLKRAVEDQAKRLDEIDRTGGTVTNLDRGSLHATVKDHEERLRKLEAAVGKIDLMALDVHYIKKHVMMLNRTGDEVIT